MVDIFGRSFKVEWNPEGFIVMTHSERLAIWVFPPALDHWHKDSFMLDRPFDVELQMVSGRLGVETVVMEPGHGEDVRTHIIYEHQAVSIIGLQGVCMKEGVALGSRGSHTVRSGEVKRMRRLDKAVVAVALHGEQVRDHTFIYTPLAFQDMQKMMENEPRNLELFVNDVIQDIPTVDLALLGKKILENS